MAINEKNIDELLAILRQLADPKNWVVDRRTDCYVWLGKDNPLNEACKALVILEGP